MKTGILIEQLTKFGLDRDVVIQTRQVRQDLVVCVIKETLGVSFDDEGVAVISEIAGETYTQTSALVTRLRDGDSQKETVIESCIHEHTADFEVVLINGIIFLRELKNSKPW